MKARFLLLIPLFLLLFNFCAAQPGFTAKQHIEIASETADTICLSLTKSGRIICFQKVIVDTLVIVPDADSNFIYFDNRWIYNADTVYILDSLFPGGFLGKGLTYIFNDTPSIYITPLGPTSQPAAVIGIGEFLTSNSTGTIYSKDGGTYLISSYIDAGDSSAFVEENYLGGVAGYVTTMNGDNYALKQLNITGATVVNQTTNTSTVGNITLSIANNAEINSGFNFISNSDQGTSTTQITTNSDNGTGEGNWTVTGADSATLNLNAITTHPTKPAFVQMMATAATNPVVEMTIIYEGNEYDVKLDTNGVNIGNSETSTDWYRFPLIKGSEHQILRRYQSNEMIWTETALLYTPSGQNDASYLAGAVTYDEDYLYIKIEDNVTGVAHNWTRIALSW